MPQAFEDLFAKWDYDNDGALDYHQFFELIRGNRVAADPIGVSPSCRQEVKRGLTISTVDRRVLRIRNGVAPHPEGRPYLQGGPARHLRRKSTTSFWFSIVKSLGESVNGFITGIAFLENRRR